MTDSVTRVGQGAGITPPVWNGYKAIEDPARGLAYDWSPMATPNGDSFEWSTRLNLAKEELGNARAFIDQMDGYSWPSDPQGVPQSMRDAMDGARKTVFPHRLDLGAPKNEIPNYLPDGSIHPDEVSTRLWDKPSVRMHLETALFRLPHGDVDTLNIAAADDALRKAQAYTFDLTYQTPEGGRDMPNISQARQSLDEIEQLIDRAILNDGADTGEAGLWARVGNRFQQLSTTQQRAAVIGAIAGAAVTASLVGLGISKSMSD